MRQPDNLRLGLGIGHEVCMRHEALGMRHWVWVILLVSLVPNPLMKTDIERVNLCEF